MKTKELQSDLLGYILWRGDLTLEQDPFNEIDGTIFSQLAYLNLKGLLDSSFNNEKSIKQVAAEYFALSDVEERNHIGAMINDNIPELFRLCAESNRFGNLSLCGYVDILDYENEEQFSAVSFRINKKLTLIAIRGTDDTLLGWKEDLNLLYTDRIPCFDAASSYIAQAEKYFKGDFIVTGHSKGGNTAVVSSSEASDSFKKRLVALYNIDGTGSRKSVYESQGYNKIKNKIFNCFPGFCTVGMFFQHPENYSLVESREFAAMQHDPLSWKVLGNKFVAADDFTDESKMFHVSINSWIERLSQEQAEKFINLLYEVILAGGAKTNTEIEKNSIVCSAKMISKLNSLESEDRKYVMEIINMLLKVFKTNLPMLSIFNFDLKANVKEEFQKISDKAKEKSAAIEAQIKEKSSELETQIKEKFKKGKDSV